MLSYRLSFQLYSARNFPPVERQLETLAQLGYDAVEPYLPVYEQDVDAFRRKVDAVGLSMPSVLSDLAFMDRNPSLAIDMAKALGAETVVLPFLHPSERPSDRAGWQAMADRIAVHARRAANSGLDLAWHNHDFEYAPLADGSRPIDLVLADDAVGWEPDIGWLARADVPIAAELDRYATKVRVFHVKDIAGREETIEDGWAAVGAGTIEWYSLWPSIAATGATLLVVEHDNPIDWKAIAESSLNYLKTLLKQE